MITPTQTLDSTSGLSNFSLEFKIILMQYYYMFHGTSDKISPFRSLEYYAIDFFEGSIHWQSRDDFEIPIA